MLLVVLSVLAMDIMERIDHFDQLQKSDNRDSLSSLNYMANEGDKDPVFQEFTQSQSHFETTNTDTWQQRYYHVPGTSKYSILYIGAEGPLRVSKFNNTMGELAKALNASKWGLEHRGYRPNVTFPSVFVSADELSLIHI